MAKSKTAPSGAKRILNIASTILVVLVVLFTVLLVGVRLFGIYPYAVLSGSMEPTYPTGSLIYVKDTPAEEIQVGDPITFVMDENLTVATHRVVEIDAASMHFTTKGDANQFIDGAPVHFNNLIGKPIFCIPKLGYIVNYIQHPPGKYIAVAMAALILMLAFVPALFEDDKDKPKKKKKGASADDGTDIQ